MKELFSKILSTFISVVLLVNSFAPSLAPGNITKPAYAEENSCTNEGIGDLRNYLATRVGGIALDRAAVFLTDMSDITGAYYDQIEDKIVFVGTKGNVSLPKFEKDDLAVAIRAIVFNNTVPSIDLSYENETNPYGSDLLVTFRGGLEDTKFGSTILDADYKYKLYLLGHNENGQRIISSVPGYKSYIDRVNEKVNSLSEYQYTTGRFTILPDKVSLKRDSSTSSFVFDEVKMRTEYEFYQPTPQAQHEAATEFTQHMTQNYDLFSEEIPSYKRTKQLAKIVGVVKWMKDNNIVNNFEWAREDQSEFYPTPRRVKSIYSTPFVDKQGKQWIFSGGTSFTTPNTYLSDTGIARSIKNSSESVPSSSTDTHWSFSNGGVQYEAVAVEADAFRNIGAYHTSVNDVSFPTSGDQSLSFYRSYSSFSGGQKGLGRGWDFIPVRLYDNKPNWFVNCTSGTVGKHPSKLGFLGPDGLYESFDYSCSTGYSADKPEYHSKITHNSDGTFTVKLTSQTEYIFDSGLKLISTKDKSGNKITYSYDSSNKLILISDSNNHSLSLTYNAQGLISSVSDWSGRKIQYSYDIQGNLTSVTDPRGNITRYEYDGNNKLSKVINRLGQVVTENTYTPEAKIASQKNSNGVILNFTYNDSTKIVSAIDSNGRTGKLKFDDKARTLESTDTLNNITKYSYGTEYLPLTVTDKKNNKTTFTYDSRGNLTSITYPDLKKIYYTYDSKNQLTKISDGRYPIAKVTTNTFDSLGNLTQISEAGILTKFGYDSYGEVISSTNHLNNTSAFTRDLFGNVLTITDPYNNQKNFEFDTLSRPIKETDEENKITQYSYDPNGNLISITSSSGINRYEYNPENLVSRSIKPNGSLTDYSYNSSNSLTQVKDATGTTTSYGYDAYQNLIAQQDGLSSTTSYAYDNLNRNTQETFPMGEVTKLEYDPNGNITKKIDAQGRSITYSYDLLNRLTKITYPTSSVTFTYDYRGNLTKMVDSIGTTSYIYDNFDRLTKVTNPYSRNVSYAYDSLGRLTKITYPDSKAVQYAYDNNSRLISATDWNSSKTFYSYSKNNLISSDSFPNGIKASYQYDGTNRISDIEYSKGSSVLAKFSYERDSLGNITKAIEQGSFFSPSEPTPTPAPTSTPTPTPTPSVIPTPTPSPTPIPSPSVSPTPTPTPGTDKPDLVVTGITLVPATIRTTTYFDIVVKVKNQGAVASSGTVRLGIYYDRSTPPTTTTSYTDIEYYYNSIAPGQEVTLTETSERFSTAGTHNVWALVDRSGSITESNETNNAFGPYNVNVIASSGSFFERFARLPIVEAIGRIFATPIAHAQTAQFITTFAYDSLGRLISANYPDSKNYSYSYDKSYNRTQQLLSGQITDYSFNANSQLTKSGEVSFGYTPMGELSSKSSTGSAQSFSYDNEGRLISFTPSVGSLLKFDYDGLGNRLYKTVGSTTTRFVNDVSGSLSNVLVETNSSNTIQKYYLYGLGMISQGGASSTSRQYLITDAQGNARFLTDSSGNKIRSYDYDPFGSIRSTSGTQDGSYRFSSEQNDIESALYFLRARYYDPESGRFISRDPVRGISSLPQTSNPYIYAWNNPINMTDPSGELPRTGIKPLDLVFAALEYGASTPVGQRCIQAAQRAYGALSKSPATQSVVSDPNKINHILQEEHAWSKVVSDPNDWNQVSQVINKVVSSGTSSPGNAPNKIIKTLQIGKEWVEVQQFTNPNTGITSIENAWVRK